MTELEKIIDAINDFFGCDAAYFDVNPFDLAHHLMDKGVTMPTKCAECRYFGERRVALVCSHPHGLKNPTPDSYCCHADAVQA